MLPKYSDWFTQRFNTKLDKSNESRFKNWLEHESERQGRDLSKDLTDYDLRGYWIDGGWKAKGEGHLTDRYKKPNHPTFSEESKYHNKQEGGIVWKGGKWGKDYKSFKPSKTMGITHPKELLQQYFQEREKDVKLEI